MPFSSGAEPFVCDLSLMSEFEATFAEAAFLVDADLALPAVARGGADLSLLELEFCELERVFLSPFADEGDSDLLFDLSERLSAGIFFQLRAQMTNSNRGTKLEGRGREHQGPRS